MPDIDRDLTTLRRGQLALATCELMDELLDALDEQVDARMYRELRKGGGVTAEAAQQAWYEKFAYEQIRSKLHQLAAAGEAASRRLTPNMER